MSLEVDRDLKDVKVGIHYPSGYIKTRAIFAFLGNSEKSMVFSATATTTTF